MSAGPESGGVHSLGALVSRLHGVTGQERVTVEDIVAAVGQGSLQAMLLVPAFLAATPLSGIPGLSMVCGIAIALIAFRLLLNGDRLSLPGWIERRSVRGEALGKALTKAAPVVRWFDRHTRPRMVWLFHPPMIWLPVGLCLISGLMMPLLEFIPFSASLAALGVSLLALAMLTRDGVLFLIALSPYAGLGMLAGGALI
ncbi:exopolysaccharide biosynthesis protein [Pararhodobacter sp.]|uniref:exopolysaccharide biosynthesis protein n=1 Tax=Pararhodobacter sp. TaxID=2127056 RepID=UPI002FDE021D